MIREIIRRRYFSFLNFEVHCVDSRLRIGLLFTRDVNSLAIRTYVCLISKQLSKLFHWLASGKIRAKSLIRQKYDERKTIVIGSDLC